MVSAIRGAFRCPGVASRQARGLRSGWMRRLTAIPGVLLIAVAAAMWGTDPIIRKTMSGTTSATTIVFGEHVILVALTLPLLFPALRAVFRARSEERRVGKECRSRWWGYRRKKKHEQDM